MIFLASVGRRRPLAGADTLDVSSEHDDRGLPLPNLCIIDGLSGECHGRRNLERW